MVYILNFTLYIVIQNRPTPHPFLSPLIRSALCENHSPRIPMEAAHSRAETRMDIAGELAVTCRHWLNRARILQTL